MHTVIILVHAHSDNTSGVHTVVILVRVHSGIAILVRIHSGITSACVHTVVSAYTQWYY